MPTLTNIFLLHIAMALASSITGPDMLYIIARSTGQGRYAGILSCLGIATGGLVQTCVVALGLSSLFLLVPIVYETMKGISAIYLIYLGTRTLFSQQEAWADPGQEKAGVTKKKSRYHPDFCVERSLPGEGKRRR